MEQETDLSRYQQKYLEDYLHDASRVLYAIAGLFFIGGVYIDWQHPGMSIIPFLNFVEGISDLFIAAFILAFVGYLVSQSSNIVDSWRTEEIEQEQDQEWSLEIGEEQ
jgi:hypothetical protein